MIARMKDQRRRAARAGQGAAMKFWEFPFELEVEAPDTAIEELETLARGFAGANWGMEFDCTAMHFRFSREEHLHQFKFACIAMTRIIPRQR
jgi:hypothetical protein